MVPSWYALRSQPHRAPMIWRQAQAMGYDTFYPRLRVQPVNPRAKSVRPYFPGYLFVRADLKAAGLSTFRYMPHAIGIVCFGGEPAIVPDHLIQALRKRVEELGAAKIDPLHGLRRGDRVTIEGGPFEGYKAVFDVRISGAERVRVLLNLLGGRNIPLELNASLIQVSKRP